MAQNNSQEPDSGIGSGVSDNPHSPMQCSDNTEVDENNTRLSSFEQTQPIEVARGLGETRPELTIPLHPFTTKEYMKSLIDTLYSENCQLKTRLATTENIAEQLKALSDTYDLEKDRLNEMLVTKENVVKTLKLLLQTLNIENRQQKEALKTKEDIEKQLKSIVGKFDSENHQLNVKLTRMRRFLGVFMDSSPRSIGAMLFLLDWTVREFSVDKETAHHYLQEQYKEVSPNLRALPSLDNLEALRQKWNSWYNKDAPPCFINTLCVWYAQTCPEVPFFFFNFDPAIHTVVTEPFVNRHFFNLLTLDFDQRKEIPELYEKRYVLCYYRTHGIGHMCVVSKEELDVIKSDNHVGVKFLDTLLQEAIEQSAITRFIICLPRGDMSSTDGSYKIAEVSTLKQLFDLPLSEPAYHVNITDGKSNVSFKWTKTPPEQQYSTTWPLFSRYLILDIHGEVRLDKGNSPFL